MADERLDVWFLGLVDKVDAAVDTAMEQIAEEGQQMVQGFISTRGTANPEYGGKSSWSRTYYKRGGGPKKNPSQGRVWSGEMRADVLGESSRPQRNVAMASFGWLENFQEYYGDQEEGFEHPSDKVGWIPGMFAMRDAADLMQKRASEIIGAELKRV